MDISRNSYVSNQKIAGNKKSLQVYNSILHMPSGGRGGEQGVAFCGYVKLRDPPPALLT